MERAGAVGRRLDFGDICREGSISNDVGPSKMRGRRWLLRARGCGGGGSLAGSRRCRSIGKLRRYNRQVSGWPVASSHSAAECECDAQSVGALLFIGRV